jgi:dehydrogenase/reductase SDR family member 12
MRPVRLAARLLGAVLDPTIVLSYDRTGYRLHRALFDPADLDLSLEGRVCLVTGANSGIGLAASRALCRLGATVLMLCRDEPRGREALEQVLREGRGDARLERIDLADLGSIRAFAGRLPEERVHVLVNNAGVLPAARVATADGLELCLATNLVGPHLLTSLLLPRLRAAGAARVVNVSSGGMYSKRLDLEALADPPEKPYDGVAAYARTKRALVVLTELWSERLAGVGVTFNSMHPGWADTPAVRSSLPRFYRLTRHILRTAEEAADTVVWLAACRRLERESGGFWFDRKRRRTHYVPWTRERPEDRARLWDLCQRLAGLPP